MIRVFTQYLQMMNLTRIRPELYSPERGNHLAHRCRGDFSMPKRIITNTRVP